MVLFLPTTLLTVFFALEADQGAPPHIACHWSYDWRVKKGRGVSLLDVRAECCSYNVGIQRHRIAKVHGTPLWILNWHGCLWGRQPWKKPGVVPKYSAHLMRF